MLKTYITGYGLLSSLGHSADDVFEALCAQKSAVKYMNEWDGDQHLHARLGAPVVSYDKSVLPRLARRTMSAMSEMASLATLDALKMAHVNISEIESDRTLLTMGSTTGSPFVLEEYFQKTTSQPGTAFFKVMNHSVASNVAVAVGFNGAVNSVSAACATSAQAAILGWELIQSGLYDMVICGGADELHHLSSSVFDNVYAASRGYSLTPHLSPRPFDQKRDGLVVSEGASVLILENEKSILRRQSTHPVKKIAEFVAGSYLCESSHMSQSNSQQMIKTMMNVLKKAQLKPEDIGYINAHATGTLQGDGQECAAIATVFHDQTPVSSLKGHFGHSMAACGIAEIIASIKMMEKGILIATKNLENVADDCKGVYHLQDHVSKKPEFVLSNNFAFGGINTSLIIKAV
jgi:3-oxoacyl-[acyl-carrier-protein] synthase II